MGVSTGTWVRLNMDGASKGNPKTAGFGGLSRGYMGEFHEVLV